MTNQGAGLVPADVPPTRSQWVSDRLRQAIITGELRPGEQLVTTALAERWSISPTPLREALRILASEGLVEMLPQRPARVAPVSYRDFAEICDIRLMLEPEALVRSLTNRDARWDERAEASLRALRQVVEDPDDDPFTLENAHRTFHEALLSSSGSVWLERTITALAERSIRFRLLSLAARGGPGMVADEHATLLEVCRSDDLDKARDAYVQHLLRTVRLVLADADDAGEVLEGLTPTLDVER